jgi:hypothetical protein
MIMNTNQVVALEVGRLTVVPDQRAPAQDSVAAPADATTYSLSCSEFAAINQVKAQTVRKRFCLTGSYFGVRPKKLANNRLAWPAVQVVA